MTIISLFYHFFACFFRGFNNNLDKTGPYVLKDGKAIDAILFEEELSKINEDKTDSILFMLEVNKRAKAIKAKRVAQKRVDS